MRVKVPMKIKRNWKIDPKRVFNAKYMHDQGSRIFKFCFQPDTGELLFDIPPTHHNMIIKNNGKMQFNDYVRGICFWDKRVIYLRGHTNERWLEKTKKMVYANGISKDFRVIWGEKAARELAKDLEGL